jgi:hypothetical protein
MKKTNGQKERLKNFLDKGGKVHRLNALTRLGIFELSARLGELGKEGYPIDKNWIVINNRFGEKIDVMLYWKDTKKALPSPAKVVIEVVALDNRQWYGFLKAFHWNFLDTGTQIAFDDYVNRYHPEALEWWYDFPNKQLKIEQLK